MSTMTISKNNATVMNNTAIHKNEIKGVVALIILCGNSFNNIHI